MTSKSFCCLNNQVSNTLTLHFTTTKDLKLGVLNSMKFSSGLFLFHILVHILRLGTGSQRCSKVDTAPFMQGSIFALDHVLPSTQVQLKQTTILLYPLTSPLIGQAGAEKGRGPGF